MKMSFGIVLIVMVLCILAIFSVPLARGAPATDIFTLYRLQKHDVRISGKYRAPSIPMNWRQTRFA